MAARHYSLTLGALTQRLSDVYGDGTGIVNAAHDLPYRMILVSAVDVAGYIGGTAPGAAGAYAAAVLADGPVAYWRLGEAAGPTIADATGNGWTGTQVSAPTFGQAGAVDGDTAIAFDAVDDAFTTALDQVSLPNTAWSLECWFKGPSAPGTSRALVSRNNVRPELLITTNGAIRILSTDAGAVQVSATGADVSDTRWHHCVGTYDGVALRIYNNGILGAAPAAANPYNPTVATWRLGALAGPAQPTNGSIDEIALYNFALGADRIAAHAALGQSMIGAILTAGAAPLRLGPYETGPVKLSNFYVSGAGSTLHILAIPF